jgi:ferredoxin-NADP reductase
MRATFDHAEQETEHIWTFWFRTEKPLEYSAGQYTELYLPHENADDRGEKRWFTLSSAPGGELVSITTKHSEPSSTFKDALFALQPGTNVDLAEAMGDFVLPKDASRPMVFVAGGIGLTPFHSIVSWLNDQGEKRDIKFLYSVRNESEIIFQDTFDAAEIVPTIVIAEPSSTWAGQTGRLNAEMILGLEKPADNALIYVSGPEPMTEALEAQLKAAGMREDQLVLDFFPNYTNDYAS